MKCARCHHENLEEARHCSHCGVILNRNAATPKRLLFFRTPSAAIVTGLAVIAAAVCVMTVTRSLSAARDQKFFREVSELLARKDYDRALLLLDGVPVSAGSQDAKERLRRRAQRALDLSRIETALREGNDEKIEALTRRYASDTAFTQETRSIREKVDRERDLEAFDRVIRENDEAAGRALLERHEADAAFQEKHQQLQAAIEKQKRSREFDEAARRGEIDWVLQYGADLQNGDDYIAQALSNCPDPDRKALLERALEAATDRNIREVLVIMENNSDPALPYIHQIAFRAAEDLYSPLSKAQTHTRVRLSGVIGGIDIHGDNSSNIYLPTGASCPEWYNLYFPKGLGDPQDLALQGLHKGNQIEVFGILEGERFCKTHITVEAWRRVD